MDRTLAPHSATAAAPTSRPRPTASSRSTAAAPATRTVVVTAARPAAAKATPPRTSSAHPPANPAAFIPPTVLSARFLGCTAGPSPGSYYWHDSIELVGGQNWKPAWGRMSGRFLDNGNVTNGNGVVLDRLDLTDQHGTLRLVPFPAGIGFSVQFADWC